MRVCCVMCQKGLKQRISDKIQGERIRRESVESESMNSNNNDKTNQGMNFLTAQGTGVNFFVFLFFLFFLRHSFVFLFYFFWKKW